LDEPDKALAKWLAEKDDLPPKIQPSRSIMLDRP